MRFNKHDLLAFLVLLFCLADADGIMFAHQAILAIWPVSLWIIFIFIITLSTIQLWSQYWLLGWSKNRAKEADVVAKFKLASRKWAERMGLDVYLEQLYILLDVLYQPIRNAIDRVMNSPLIKRGGCPALVVLGLIPFYGFRTPGMIICRATNWRLGMWILVASNALRIWYMLFFFAFIMRTLRH